MIEIDGSYGEGGGQLLRTALALSLATKQPFRAVKLRAKRAKPGLMRQHLTAVQAAMEIGRARVIGAEIGSSTLEFYPREVAAGEYRFSVGTAGSATLVLQTVLPALMIANGPSSIVLEGGTHNPLAPTFDFLARVYLPLLSKMGVHTSAAIERPGFYPAGGGKFRIDVTPVKKFARLDLIDRGEVRARRATAMFAQLPFEIARRELEVVREQMKLEADECSPVEVKQSHGPGNVVQVEIESDHVTELFSGFGERGVRGEVVAQKAAKEALDYLAANVPVGPHLADQLLLPMALAGGGSFRSVAATPHTETQIQVIRYFLATKVACSQVSADVWQYEVSVT